jgi:23S rRNA pseudouridine2605 synthase
MGVPLNRALSKLGALSRARATAAVREGRVAVDGRVVRDPAALVTLTQARIDLDGRPVLQTPWRTILFHKPRGVVTTRSDPEGRRTIYDVLGETGHALRAVGRLDLATTGLLLLTSDTQLAGWITDPASEVPRIYLVTVRGLVTEEQLERVRAGIRDGRDRLRARAVAVRKASSRETHLTVELREGKNREIRRLFHALGHEVTRLKRVRFGRLDLGPLGPGQWRELRPADIRAAFPGAPVAGGSGRRLRRAHV